MLHVFSDSEDEATLSKTARERCWQQFLRGGTTHSGRATTLPYLMRRAERAGVPYVLTAHPGVGYHLRPGDEIK